MDVITSTRQSLNISRSPTDYQFDVVRNEYTYATVTGKVTSGGVTFYSWTAMLPGRTGGLELAPQLGGGSISPLADPLVQLNESVPLAVGATALIRRRSSHATYGSIWEAIFLKPKDKSSSGILPGENEPVLCTWAGFIFDAPTFVGGDSWAPNGSSFIHEGMAYARHKYWFLAKVSGPYGIYYLDTDPWGVSYWWGGSVYGSQVFTYGTTTNLGYTLPFQCIVYNSNPNLAKPFQYNIEVYRTTFPFYWIISGATPGVADLNSAGKCSLYPSGCTTSNYKLLPFDYVQGPSGSFNQYPVVTNLAYHQVTTPKTVATQIVGPNVNLGVITQDPMELGKNRIEITGSQGAVALSMTRRVDYNHTTRLDYLSYPRTGWPTNEPLHDPVFSRFVLTQFGPDPNSTPVGAIG